MPDRRTAKASRLLDPQWHWLATARERLYAEIEPGAEIVGMGLTVRNPDGTVIAYGVNTVGKELTRMIITDPDAFADDLAAGTIDATAWDGEVPNA